MLPIVTHVVKLYWPTSAKWQGSFDHVRSLRASNKTDFLNHECSHRV